MINKSNKHYSIPYCSYLILHIITFVSLFTGRDSRIDLLYKVLDYNIKNKDQNV